MKNLIALACLLTATACLDDEGGQSSQNLPELEVRVKGLEYNLDRLQNDVRRLHDELYETDSKQNRLSFDLDQRFASKATFSPNSKGYNTVWTPAGNLLVALTDIKKYANGYKLYFKIGNPTFATFSSVKMNVAWNKTLDGGLSMTDLRDWAKNEKSTTVNINGDIIPGKWNNTDVVISPAKEEDTGYIEIQLETSAIYLNR